MSYPLITHIHPESIAGELGILPGDSLVSMNGQPICDIFDYRFHCADEEVELVILKDDGQEWTFEVEKDEMEDLGLTFENPLIDVEHGCTNRCVFCFIDQLPPGLRESLYFKDDDARLSFLYGNYITMTNMKESELDRMIRYRMSPINVSVHATNPELRIRMLGNRFAGNILTRVQKLVDAGITVNAQIVLCRGWNDGEELERSLRELTDMAPGLHSISIVPVGLTRYRENLPQMKAFEKKSSQEVLRTTMRWQQTLLDRLGTRTVYAADEFYLMAGIDLPGTEAYEDFPQIENGVGMLTSLQDEFWEELAKFREEGGLNVESPAGQQRHVTIASGTSAAPYLERLVTGVASLLDGTLQVRIVACENRFFGGQVNVTGLLTGSDLLEQLTDLHPETHLLLSRSMFRADTEMMLDNVERRDLEKRLGVPVQLVDPDGAHLLMALLGKESPFPG